MSYKKNEDTNKWVHREIYEMNFGKILPYYEVHHIDKNPLNNDPNNLISIPKEFHEELHYLDKMGIVLRSKIEVEIAMAFYYRGFAKKRYKNMSHRNNIKNKKNKHKVNNRIHVTSIKRNYKI